jgi:hypothetical protein
MDILLYAPLLLILAALVIGGIVAISWDKKDKPSPYADYNYLYSPGAFRGELGSPGTSPKVVGPHSSNCECMICLHGHDPDDGLRCKCKGCEGYRMGKPLY